MLRYHKVCRLMGKNESTCATVPIGINCNTPSSLSSLGHSVTSSQSVAFFGITWRKPMAKFEGLCLGKYFSLYLSSKWTAQVQVIFLLYSLEDADFEKMTSTRRRAFLKHFVGDGQEK
jgi:hypothetical protein